MFAVELGFVGSGAEAARALFFKRFHMFLWVETLREGFYLVRLFKNTGKALSWGRNTLFNGSELPKLPLSRS